MNAPAGSDVRRKAWRIVRIASGSVLLVLGVIGLVVPILQGWALILAGLAVLARDVPWARRWLNAVRDRIRRMRPSSHRTAEQGGEAKPPAAEDRDAQGGGQAG